MIQINWMNWSITKGMVQCDICEIWIIWMSKTVARRTVRYVVICKWCRSSGWADLLQRGDTVWHFFSKDLEHPEEPDWCAEDSPVRQCFANNQDNLDELACCKEHSLVWQCLPSDSIYFDGYLWIFVDIGYLQILKSYWYCTSKMKY